MNHYKTKVKIKFSHRGSPPSPLKKVKFFICGVKTNVGFRHLLRVDAYHRNNPFLRIISKQTMNNPMIVDAAEMPAFSKKSLNTEI